MDIRAIILGLGFCFMWSSAFTSARVIVDYAPPLTTLAIRFYLAGFIGIGIAWMMGQRPTLTAGQWRAVVIFGLCQNALYLGFNFIAMQTVEASFASIIASTLPLLVAVAGWLVYRERPSPLAFAGLAAGFVGVALIMGSRLQGGIDPYGTLLCVAAVFALTVATMAVRSASGGGNLLMIVGLQMLVGAVILTGPAIVFEPWDVTWSWQLGTAFAYTVVVPGLLATWVWFVLVERIGMVKAATFHFVNPFFGVAIAAALLGEAITSRDILGVAIIAGGILAVQIAKQR